MIILRLLVTRTATPNYLHEDILALNLWFHKRGILVSPPSTYFYLAGWLPTIDAIPIQLTQVPDLFLAKPCH